MFATKLRKRRLRPLVKDDSGTAAIEFAILAPVLVLSLLATRDVGFGISEWMHMDHSLRAGAESAMRDPGKDNVKKVIESVASDEFTIASGSGSASSHLSVDVDRYCACPENLSATVECAEDEEDGEDEDSEGACADGTDPSVFYRLTVEKQFTTVLLPAFPLNTSVLVQVR